MDIKINPEELRQKVKLFVATPCYGGQCHGMYMKSCLDLQALCVKYGIELKFSFLFNESLVQRARNYLASEFMESGFTHMLWIDSDIAFNPMDVLAMLSLPKDQFDGIVCAPYSKKSQAWHQVWRMAKRLLANPNFDETKFNPAELSGVTGEIVFNPVPGTKRFSVIEPVEVMESGTGFMLIERKIYEKWMEEYPHLSYKPDHKYGTFDGNKYIHAFFHCEVDPDTHRYLSEDYFFCQMWRKAGGKIWLCPWIKTEHYGTIAFQGDLRLTAALTGELTN